MRTIIVITLALFNTIFLSVGNFKKNKKDISFLYALCNSCDIIMYIILRARTGIANSTANFLKNLAYSKLDNFKFTIMFSLLRIILLIIGYDSFATMIFIILEIVQLFILKYGSAQHLRILTTVRQGVWIVYDFMFANVIVACFTAIGFISCFTATIRNIKQKELKGE